MCALSVQGTKEKKINDVVSEINVLSLAVLENVRHSVSCINEEMTGCLKLSLQFSEGRSAYK